MAIRKRMLEPHIWEDPDFNKLSHQSRLLFIGMISNADDYGYLRADSGSLKRLIFGFDEIKKEEVEVWRKEIEVNMKNIHFYEIQKEQYAHFLKWPEYQKQQKDRMQPSTYPLCSKCIANAKQLQTEVKRSKEKIDIVANATDSTFSYKEALEKMKSDKCRHIQIIALYWKWRGLEFLSKELYQKAISRDCRAAKLLVGYSDKEIQDTMDYIDGLKFISKPTLETVNKYIAELKAGNL